MRAAAVEVSLRSGAYTHRVTVKHLPGALGRWLGGRPQVVRYYGDGARAWHDERTGKSPGPTMCDWLGIQVAIHEDYLRRIAVSDYNR